MKLSHKRLQDLEELEDNIGYKFNNKELLNFAFIHSSYSNENKDYENKNNERLEFLGDVVVSLIVSRELFLLFKDVPEGDLTRMRSQIVCEKSFSEAAVDLNLGKYLLLSKGEENTGGRTRESILADTFEAFCGAVFLDSDFNNISEFLINRFKNIAARREMAALSPDIADFRVLGEGEDLLAAAFSANEAESTGRLFGETGWDPSETTLLYHHRPDRPERLRGFLPWIEIGRAHV